MNNEYELVSAFIHNETQKALNIMDKPYNMFARDLEKDNTLLFIAAQNLNPILITKLCTDAQKKGHLTQLLETPSPEGVRALMVAAHGISELTRKHLRKISEKMINGDVNMLAGSSDMFNSFTSILKNNAQCTRILVDFGADVNAKDFNGNTALHYAVKGYSIYRNKDKIEGALPILLNSEKMNINVQNNEGKTPILLAVENGAPLAFEYLLERGADVNITDNKGRLPMKCIGRQLPKKIIGSLIYPRHSNAAGIQGRQKEE